MFVNGGNYSLANTYRVKHTIDVGSVNPLTMQFVSSFLACFAFATLRGIILG